MQIDILNNKYSTGIGFIWEKFKKYLGWIILVIYLLFQGCVGSNKTENTIKKTIPGTFKVGKATHVPLTKETISERARKGPENNSSFIDKETQKYYKDLENRLYEMTKQNDSLKQNFASLPDTLKQKEYEKAIRLNLFHKKYQNKDLTASFTGVVQGEIKEVKFTYELEPLPETQFRLLLGGGVGINKELNQGVYKLNAGYQNKKGNIWRASYMQIGNQTYGLAEYDFSIWNRKK